MEDDDKAKIIALSEQRKAAPQSAQSKFSVNAHTATLIQDTPPDDLEDLLLAMVTQHSNWCAKPSSHLGDICSVLSQAAKAAKVQVKDKNGISINNHTYMQQVQCHNIQYNVSQASCKNQGYLIDGEVPTEVS